MAGRLATVHDSLHRWDRSVLKRPTCRIKNAKKEFEELVKKDLTEENIAREKELAAEIEKIT